MTRRRGQTGEVRGYKQLTAHSGYQTRSVDGKYAKVFMPSFKVAAAAVEDLTRPHGNWQTAPTREAVNGLTNLPTTHLFDP